MMPQFSKADLNKFWHGVQNEVALICAKFGKDLFSISKVIGRKTKQSGPGFFGLPGRSPHRHIPRIKGMHRNNTQSKWDRRRVRSLSWFTSSWKLIINSATTVLFRGERTTHVFTTVADRSITRVNVYATLIHCLPLRPIKLSTSFSLSAFLPCFYRTFLLLVGFCVFTAASLHGSVEGQYILPLWFFFIPASLISAVRQGILLKFCEQIGSVDVIYERRSLRGATSVVLKMS